MFKNLLTFLFIIVCFEQIHAQNELEGYYPYAIEETDQRVLIETDTILFYRSVQPTHDLYGAISAYNLPFINTGRRGGSHFDGQTTINGTTCRSQHLGLLRQMGATLEHRYGFNARQWQSGITNPQQNLAFSDDPPRRNYRFAANYSDRNYRFRARFSSYIQLPKNWVTRIGIEGRTGRDAQIEGVFTNAVNFGLDLSKQISEKERFSCTFLLPLSMRGGRQASSMEAFELTNDPLYNPSWGYQNGKIRNARIHREVLPMLLLNYELPLTHTTSLQTKLTSEVGRTAQSRLGWYNARSPQPDNYRNMPSYTQDQQTEWAWQHQDRRLTQINWDQLIQINHNAWDHHARYALEDWVKKLLKIEATAQFQTQLNENLLLHYGVQYQMNHSRNFKEMRDLLGAEFINDIDQYLIDDDTYNNKLENNVRHPQRKIHQGDRFGFDYALKNQQFSVLIGAEYRGRSWHLEGAFRMGRSSVNRRGYYEKELFPESQSWGNSPRIKFNPFALNLVAGYSFTPERYIEVNLEAAHQQPRSEDLFIQPLYNNRPINNPQTEKHYNAAITYRHNNDHIEYSLTAFVHLVEDQTKRINYFDDISATYSDLSVSGINRSAYGIEGAMTIRLSRRWQAAICFGVSDNTYTDNPRLTILSDIDNSLIDQAATCYIKGSHVGIIPHITGCAELNYRGRKGWGMRLSAGYAGVRYIDPSYVRRTERVLRYAGLIPENRQSLLDQERLKDAFTLNASILKTIFFRHGYLTMVLSMRNITDHSSPYTGYESMRLQKIHAGVQTYYRSQDSRYSYTSPRAIFATVSYNF